MNHNPSRFMHWAKVRPKVKYDLALSGVLNLPLAELEVSVPDLELHGDNAYGYPPLVAALAAHSHASPECVVTISGGTSMANHLAMAAVLEPGDEVLIEQPTYEPLLALVGYLGATIKRFPRKFENSFAVDIDELASRISSKTRLIVLTNLHNPSSVLTPNDTLRQIAELSRHAEARVLVDEVYLEALFAEHPGSAFHLADHFIVTTSLTKAYGLSGLRCGWILAEPALAEKMRRLNDIFGAVAPYAMDKLSLFALSRLPQIAARARHILETNRAHLNEFFATRDDLETLPTKIGTTSFPRLRHGNVEELCTLLETEYDTAVVPGAYFESPSHFRVGLCCEPEKFREGIARLSQALDRLPSFSKAFRAHAAS